LLCGRYAARRGPVSLGPGACGGRCGDGHGEAGVDPAEPPAPGGLRVGPHRRAGKGSLLFLQHRRLTPGGGRRLGAPGPGGALACRLRRRLGVVRFRERPSVDHPPLTLASEPLTAASASATGRHLAAWRRPSGALLLVLPTLLFLGCFLVAPYVNI